MKQTTEKKLLKKLRKVVTDFLDKNVKTPSLETVSQDFSAQNRLVSLMVLVRKLNYMVYEHGSDFDTIHLQNLSETEFSRRLTVMKEVVESEDFNELEEKVSVDEVKDMLNDASSKKYLLTYFTRELEWITVSILSASYVSSMIIMRAIFELIVGIASRDSNGMTSRITSISFIHESDRADLKKLWYRLCAWSHPYGKWIKEICPIYTSHRPVYHKVLCNMCIEELENIIDFYVVVTLAKYEIKISEFVTMLKENQLDIKGLYLTEKHIKDG